jgi:hypothetical protein
VCGSLGNVLSPNDNNGRGDSDWRNPNADIHVANDEFVANHDDYQCDSQCNHDDYQCDSQCNDDDIRANICNNCRLDHDNWRQFVANVCQFVARRIK